MDDFLSGREELGDKPLPRKSVPLLSQGALEKLRAPTDGENVSVKEDQGAGGSRVAYVTENDRVTKIVVTCACGQVTEIDCEYSVD